ncbi:hypothetical protein [Tomitella cavernea]|uniref:Uncharacterized protein n=1 Tax=Tomitella cavernea TaxID=1387982 RepID=A0ABP9CG32_9ACTN|nr:hypothetical protein [Tomitella cavernea]
MEAGRATLVMGVVGGFAGEARCYRMDPPLAGHEFVTVFTSVGPVDQRTGEPSQQETVVVPSHGPERGGAAKIMVRLPGSISGFASHAYALFVAGYALEEAADGHA